MRRTIFEVSLWRCSRPSGFGGCGVWIGLDVGTGPGPGPGVPNRAHCSGGKRCGERVSVDGSV